MNTILFAAAAYLFLLPLLKFIPVKLAVKQKVIISSLSFCIAILSLIGGEFLPLISLIALVILLTGLTAYFVESRLQNLTALQPDPQPESIPSAVRHHEPIVYETTDENLTDYDREPALSEGFEEESFAEGGDGYIDELNWEVSQQEQTVDDEILAIQDRKMMNGVDELSVLEKRIPDRTVEPASFDEDEEEEYNRLFSGMER
ncbi:hypothetical protein V6B33_11055 [Mangrovibacillus sp. Mu-81]|jgi:hypothetical protein|uniref:hypothetical protein n=1 Tax=Mangrovibacillus sp. Mu-81 TaxID=3121478 RepID=UPI002FE48D6A